MEYRVLARKYRPATFDDLIGQSALVQTVSNAIKSGRIAHAFLLTGIRGVGKTTTARIIARALNCIGEDGKGGPTITPCGVCSNCRMIAEGRHIDILEMDAASHTGVDDVRDLIDSVRYLPTAGRYKIYIIDEVHMLSNNAFNALLKTLEEPPPHVKFIFATTEARKIPVTILSRCQRFDLKRIDTELLASHLSAVAAKEKIEAEADALKLIAVAAEGSVRDALSLLDQAIARITEADEKMGVTAASVRQMLGSADKAATFRLLETLLKGNVAETLAEIRKQYSDGSDPLLVVQDSLEIIHLITRVKVAPVALADITLSEHDRASARHLADCLSMPVLARLWQMLLKGVTEIRQAPSPLSALEMLMVRIAYAAQMPTPAEVIRNATNTDPSPSSVGTVPTPAAPAAPQPNGSRTNALGSFAEAVALFKEHREVLLALQLNQEVRPVHFEPGLIELSPVTTLPRDFISKVAALLTAWTGQKWRVQLSDKEGRPSLHEEEMARKEKQIQEVSSHPLVSSVLEQFPGAKLVDVKTGT